MRKKAAALMPAELTVTTNEMMIAVTNFFIKNGIPINICCSDYGRS